MAFWYINGGNGTSTGYYAVTQWATGAKTAGTVVRQLTAPAVGSERCFVCTIAGTSGGTEPTWVLTRGAKTTDSTVTWMECTGLAGTNGSLTNTAGWALGAVALGALIHGVSNATTSLFICTTAGTISGAEPTWNTTTGATTTSGTAVFTCLGLASGFTAFQNPHARLFTVINTFHAAGDTQYVADTHAETQAAAMTIAAANTPNQTYCVDHTVATPTAASLKTTATVTTTGANALIVNGNGYFYGITFSAGTGAVSQGIQLQSISAGYLVLDTCTLITGGTVSIGINVGSGGTTGIVELVNTSAQFSISSSRLNIVAGTLRWRNSTALTGASVRPGAIFATGSGTGVIELTAVDFTGYTGTLFFAQTGGHRVQIKNCKFDPATTPVATPTVAANWMVDILQSDSGTKYYRHERWRTQGVQIVNTTNIKQGGASDGITPLAWQLDPLSLVTWYLPFESIPIMIWNIRTGVTVNATVCILYDAHLTPSLTNQDVWIEVEYMGTSGSPLGAFVNSGLPNYLATPTALTTDSTSIWNTTGLTTPTLCTLTASFTPQNVGFIKTVVKCSNAAATIYVDPKVILS
jgi:hypothetical protein